MRPKAAIVAVLAGVALSLQPAFALDTIRVGKSVPIHTGEAYDGPGTALVPAVRVEDFYMTSVSPAV